MSTILRRTLVLGVALLASGCVSHRAWLLSTIALQEHVKDVHVTPHHVALLEVGRDALLYRIERIRAAREEVCLQTFIMEDCATTRWILHELVLAARRGVKVRILVDKMFSGAPIDGVARLVHAHPSLEIRATHVVMKELEPSVAAKLSAVPRLVDLNRRAHNKLFVVDGKWGVTGGRNYTDDYYDESARLVYRDRDVAVRGPVVKDMLASFDRQWAHEWTVPLSALTDVARASKALPESQRGWRHSLESLGVAGLSKRMAGHLAAGAPRLEWFAVDRIAFWADQPTNPGPQLDPEGICRRLVCAVGAAEERLLIQSPYLVLTDRAIELFRQLRERGVPVQISTNSLASTDNWPSYAHAMLQRKQMLKELAFDIREMKPQPADRLELIPDYERLRTAGLRKDNVAPPPIVSLHAKSMVIDRGLALVGSYNLDPRSAAINSEVILAVWDERFAAALAAQIERDCAPRNAWQVALKKRPLPQQLIMELAEFLNKATQGVAKLDLWAVRSTALFELREGRSAVPLGSEKFYERFREVGQFPRVDSMKKQILVELARSLTGFLRPLMRP